MKTKNDLRKLICYGSSCDEEKDIANGPTPLQMFPYSPAWPQQFDELREALAGKLRSLVRRIEHVGSTAIPGLSAKPILDIDLVVATPDRLAASIAALEELGYRHQGDLGIAGREAFEYSGRDVPHDGSGREWPQHHLYACLDGHRELQRHLAFRDYLRQHAQEAEIYGLLKQRLAHEFAGDRRAYSEGKSEFVREILGRVDPALAAD